MTGEIVAYVFDSDFGAGPSITCVVRRSELKMFMSVRKLDLLFSRYVIFQAWPLKFYAGVWGRRNASRLRRFLRELGADVQIDRRVPPNAVPRPWKTHGKRKRVRSLIEV
jgi:hypothetical protein